MAKLAGNAAAIMKQTRFAMGLSLAFGFVMLIGKSAAYLLTGSAAILSDAAESVIHVIAVAFAAFSLWLSHKPANDRFLYGYERVSFFSAGFEGALIIFAAVLILAAATHKLISGFELENLGAGTLLTFAASVINAGLGAFLVYTGRRTRSLILEANGKHVLTDSWTSFGVVGGLCLVLWTGWKPFDPILAMLVALNILWSGGRLVRMSIKGLMDSVDPATAALIRQNLDALCSELQLRHHHVRFRSTGQRLLIELHLLFAQEITVGEAHRRATLLEERLPEALGYPAEILTHLEAVEDHNEIHGEEHA